MMFDVYPDQSYQFGILTFTYNGKKRVAAIRETKKTKKGYLYLCWDATVGGYRQFYGHKMENTELAA